MSRLEYITKGTKLLCLHTINNLYRQPLFEKGQIYEVLYINKESVKVMITLNHTLYANEYAEYDLEWISKNFKIIES
jgi:hypothetical protein